MLSFCMFRVAGCLLFPVSFSAVHRASGAFELRCIICLFPRWLSFSSFGVVSLMFPIFSSCRSSNSVPAPLSLINFLVLSLFPLSSPSLCFCFYPSFLSFSFLLFFFFLFCLFFFVFCPFFFIIIIPLLLLLLFFFFFSTSPSSSSYSSFFLLLLLLLPPPPPSSSSSFFSFFLVSFFLNGLRTRQYWRDGCCGAVRHGLGRDCQPRPAPRRPLPWCVLSFILGCI